MIEVKVTVNLDNSRRVFTFKDTVSNEQYARISIEEFIALTISTYAPFAIRDIHNKLKTMVITPSPYAVIVLQHKDKGLKLQVTVKEIPAVAWK